MPASFRGDEMVESQTAHRAQNGGDMAVREASDNLEGLLKAPPRPHHAAPDAARRVAPEAST